MTIKHHLILGGARSGKSSFAEQQAKHFAEHHSSSTLNYVATAICFDEEMHERVAHHQARRGEEWCEHEVPTRLPEALAKFGDNDVVLVDCLTLWLNNIIFELGDDATNSQVEEAIDNLARALQGCKAHVVMVSNEVGLGVVPMGKVSRLFVDNAGRMNQVLARLCARVTFVTAGLPMELKNIGNEG
ncbi:MULTISPECIES: bifunctional adenosylcobinamide kinase/adenosylcobinamide-phosphate guanylyltransferase [Vibrio]|uniref:bifunctional adenosylcobinamide kinase/adenosylcobinamide-phosphate guanylyltransferase n=1 Tax=Vibrio TaxID=662 RepID=UPI001FCAECB1|nr:MULTISPECIES: bifunctional adenosylcobinamide kinase/adenosylcobinamide-phosphate guanylyltransferase [Vibrio]